MAPVMRALLFCAIIGVVCALPTRKLSQLPIPGQGPLPVPTPVPSPATTTSNVTMKQPTLLEGAPTGMMPWSWHGPQAEDGKEIKDTWVAYMSPWQEGGEEADTPSSVPSVFQSTPPSLTRKQREEAGHMGVGLITYNKELSTAYVEVHIKGINESDINLFHIHCGQPGVLGPILIDFSLFGTPANKLFVNGTFKAVVRSTHIAYTALNGTGSALTFATLGCAIQSASLSTPVKESTIAGMHRLSNTGDLYFNLHTVHQTYYGDIRGQILPLDK